MIDYHSSILYQKIKYDDTIEMKFPLYLKSGYEFMSVPRGIVIIGILLGFSMKCIVSGYANLMRKDEVRMEPITQEDINNFENDYKHNEKAKAMRHALYNNALELCVSVQENMKNNQHHFSIDIPTMKASNQFTSGRCWIFAGLNMLREEVGKRLHIKEFELSQNYVAFYDKLEKINTFMEQAIAMRDKEIDDRLYVWLLSNGISDGGQWDLFVHLIKKYGIVPKDAMCESYHSSNTATMNVLLNTRMRKFAQEVRNLHVLDKQDEILSLKKNVLKQMYEVLCTCFGQPPKEFSFSYSDQDETVHHIQNCTPMSFFHEHINLNLDEYVSIIHAPTKDKPFYELFEVAHLNSVDAKAIQYMNLPLQEFKKAVIDQLSDHNLVWFGSDCSKNNDKKGGFWDDQSFDYQSAFDTDFTIDKESALDMRDSTMNHAMVLSGVDMLNEAPQRWKIENSWGEEAGKKGYFVASDTWFDLYVYQSVIHKRYLSKTQLMILQKQPKILQPWDPFGTLAK